MEDSLSEALLKLKESPEGERLLLDFEREMSALSEKYGMEIDETAKETETSLQKYWQKEMQRLESKLESISLVISSQEEELLYRSERESWKKDERPALEGEFKKKAQEHLEEALKERRHEMESELDSEVKSLLQDVIEELQTQFKEKLKEQCYEELRNDKEYLLRLSALDKMSKDQVTSIRKSIESKVEDQVRRNKIHEIREIAAKEAEEENAHLVYHIEEHFLKEIRETEANIESQFNQMISEDVQAKTDKIDRTLNINFLKQREKMIKFVQEKKYKEYLASVKDKKDNLKELRATVSRLKSKFNITMKEFSDKRNAEIDLLNEKEEILDKKIRQMKYDEYYEENYKQSVIEKDFNRQGESRYKEDSYISDMQTENYEVPTPDVNLEISPEIQPQETATRTLINPKSSKEFFTTLLVQNIENAKHKNWVSFDSVATVPIQKVYEPPVIEIPKEEKEEKQVTKKKPRKAIRGSLYETLLDKYLGIVEPRRRK